VRDFLGSLDQGTETPESVEGKLTTLSSMLPGIPSQTIAGWHHLIVDDPNGLAHGIQTAQNMAIGPAGGAQPTAAPPTPTGAPRRTTIAQANYGGGTYPVGTEPGFAERQAGYANLDTQLAGNLANAAEGSPGRIALLGNLQDALTKFTAGPGADWTKVAKSFVNRNVPLPAGWQFSPSSIAGQEEFVKQAAQLAQQQFQAIGGTGTDAKFSSAFTTNPNDTLSQLGNQNIIRLLKGNEAALQAKNNAWLTASSTNPRLSYRQFSNAFNASYDPRAFQFQYMSPSERSTYVANMDPNDRARFLNALTTARINKWINF